MRKNKNITFGRIEDILYLLRRPFDALSQKSPIEMFDAMKDTKQMITVHYYPLGFLRTKDPKNLMEYVTWSHNQMYFAINDDEINYCYTNGDTSSRREYHNHLIDLFLQNPKMQKKTDTAILVMNKKDILSCYFHEGYAYVDHNIDSNYHQGIQKKVEDAKLPFSRLENASFLANHVTFNDNKNKMTIYRTIFEGINRKKF